MRIFWADLQVRLVTPPLKIFSGASGRLAVLARSSVCGRSCLLAAVRGCCCTSALYLVRLTPCLQRSFARRPDLLGCRWRPVRRICECPRSTADHLTHRHATGTPLPMHAVQTAGRQVCAFPSHMHPGGGDQTAATACRAPILEVHDRSYASGLPSGGLHPIGADHCPEREPSRAWSAGLARCFGRAEAQCPRGWVRTEGARAKGSWNP